MISFQTYLDEMKKTVYNVYWIEDNKDKVGYFEINNIKYKITVDLIDENLDFYLFKFGRLNDSNITFELTGDNNEVGSIIYTIQHELTNLMLERKPYIGFSAALKDKGRIRVYDKRTSNFPGYVTHTFIEGLNKYYILAMKDIVNDLDKIRELLVKNYILR